MTVAATANTTIGKPNVREYRERICLPTAQVPDLIYALAAMYGEEDWDGVDEIVERAMSTINEGSTTMPNLASSLLSMGLTGSYTAAKDGLNAAFAASGHRCYVFEHNDGLGRMNMTLYSAYIRIEPVLADHSLCLATVKIKDSKITADMKGTVEQVLAESLGVKHALMSVSVTTPIEIVGKTQYRFDIEPFADALRKHGAVPDEHMPLQEINARSIADLIEKQYLNQCDRTAGDLFSTQIRFTMPDGIAGTLGFHGCKFSTWDIWEQERTVHAIREGIVFSGPIRNKFKSTELEHPTIWINIGSEASSYLPDREQLALDAATNLAAAITDLHNY
jgi:hypothetical protein